ncbi:D-apionate lactonase [Sinorhizobium fredii]|uniref:D-apionate lactonase n=1 Tax=Rhizobium fredii TaxID=380 RepID=UPI003510FE43
MTPSRAFLLFGTEERQPESRRLEAGRLDAELVGGNLRMIRFSGTEVVRAISFLVRDRDWGTCAAAITNLSVEQEEAATIVRYNARFQAPDGAVLECRAAIEVFPDALIFDARFTPDRDFETARAGFAILHPIVGVAGRPVAVEHGDGSIERSVFPDLIEPWQPFKDIAAITHEVMPAVEAECRMAGDIFEMEDQRNWTDGSYKTYVRPLALPWPYVLKAGETVHQAIRLSIRQAGAAIPEVDQESGPIAVSLRRDQGTLPAIGIGLKPDEVSDELLDAGLIRALDARHLVCHFDPDAGHGAAALRHFRQMADSSGAEVTLECFVPCRRPLDVELGEVARMVRDSGLRLASLAVSPSVDRQSTPPGSIWPECPPLEDVYAAAERTFPNVPLGGGMFSYFTELNRKRVSADRLSYVTHCTNPIVHAADDLSVMQSFEALRDVTRSVRAIYGDKPYRIGPSTIAMRQNPYGSQTKDNPSGKRIAMANRDPRHNALFGAAWTLAYAAAVAHADLEVLTLSTLAGPFGLVAGPGEPVKEGHPRPLFHVVRWLAALSGGRRIAVKTSAPDRVVGLGAALGETSTLLFANLTPDLQAVRLAGPGRRRLTLLDENWLREGAAEPEASAHEAESVVLPAYAVARIDIP